MRGTESRPRRNLMRRRALSWPTAILLAAILLGPLRVTGSAQDALDKFVMPLSGPGRPSRHLGKFSGYTNYWQSIAWSWYQHGNLFLIGQPNVAVAIAQNKADIAEEIGLPGLVVDEGFIATWLRSQAAELEARRGGLASRARERGRHHLGSNPSSPLGTRLLAQTSPRMDGSGRLSAAIRPGPGLPGDRRLRARGRRAAHFCRHERRCRGIGGASRSS